MGVRIQRWIDDVWTDGWVGEQMTYWIDDWKDKWVYRWMDGQVGVSMDW